MAEKCSSDCSQRPTEVSSTRTLQGRGYVFLVVMFVLTVQVIAGYIATAGIAVVVITVHYFLAYQPTLDPFRNVNGVSRRGVPYSPNPADVIILRTCRPKPKPDQNPARWSFINARLIKCILAMSDLQLATGIAILISGYAQLQCGLSCYHWMVLGRLAWFSSLTHLSCLTLLRNYLHNRKAERHWRLFFMLVLVVLLAFAMVPTGNYNWNYDIVPGDILPSEHALCHFSVPAPRLEDRYIVTMGLVVTLVFGFITRAAKLHKSVSFMGETVRSRLSRAARAALWVLYRWKNSHSGRQRLIGFTCYYPSLALFLALRALLDHLSSMFFEVRLLHCTNTNLTLQLYWLLISFLIGMIGFFIILQVATPYPVARGGSIWTFGQIMPLLLLVVPLINIFEAFYPEEHERRIPVEPNTNTFLAADDICLDDTIPLVSPESSSARNDPHPDQNFYTTSSVMGAATAFILVLDIAIAVVFILGAVVEDLVLVVTHIRVGWLVPPFFLWVVILVSFGIDRVAPSADKDTTTEAKRRRRLMLLLQTLNVCCFPVASVVLMMGFFGVGWSIMPSDAVVQSMYILHANKMNFEYPPDLVQHIERIDTFITSTILPLQHAADNNRFFDHRREYARTNWDAGGLPRREWEELLNKARLLADTAGLYRFALPSVYGGSSHKNTNLYMSAIRFHLSSHPVYGGGVGLANDLQNEHSVVGNFPDVLMLHHFGNEAQRNTFIPMRLQGEFRTTFGLTEPGHGSDATFMSTTASRKEKDGAGWEINGAKKWQTGAHHCTHMIIFARTSGVDGEAKGITAFLVPRDTEGIEVVSYEWTFNMPTDHATVTLNNVFVSEDCVLGKIGSGLAIAQTFVHENRIRQAASSCGAAKFCLDRSIERARSKEIWGKGKKLADHQGIQFPVVELMTQVEMLRLLILKTSGDMDRVAQECVESGETPWVRIEKELSDKVAMCNYWANRLACQAADRAIQIHGGDGYSRHYPFEHIYRHFRRYRITEGSEEIQMRKVAAYLFGFGGKGSREKTKL